MNKKTPLLLLALVALTGCNKTKLLYGEHAYNFADFDKNYYVEWEDIKDLTISSSMEGFKSSVNSSINQTEDKNSVIIGGKKNEDYKWYGTREEEFGYNNNLIKTEKKFSYGITSKIFDGRVRCEGYYQESRVQLTNTGFAMYFPKSLVSAKYLAFSVRGGTNYPNGENFALRDLNVNFNWSFYIHLDDGTYNKVTYTLNNIQIPVDYGDEATSVAETTSLVSFVPYIGDNFSELYGAVAMSFEWSCNDERLTQGGRNLTDNYLEKEKHHLALMLYEVFIGDSTWY